jgi:hypothetical protein
LNDAILFLSDGHPIQREKYLLSITILPIFGKDWKSLLVGACIENAL